MTGRPATRASRDVFETVRTLGLALPDVEAATKYDGTPVLKVRGVFMAGLAAHRSAEAGTLVVRCDVDTREYLLADAPDTYYVTDYYRPHPVVLVRLSRAAADALRDLLAVSWRMGLAKAPRSHHHAKDDAEDRRGEKEKHKRHERRSQRHL